MDPSNSTKDVTLCDLCLIATVEMYCDFCHVNLCLVCTGKHISDDYNKHKVVPFEQRNSTLIYPKCAKHETKICEFYCKECNNSLCSLCTTLSNIHESHTLSTLFDLFYSKRRIIRKDSEELENRIFPTYDEIVSDLKSQIAILDSEYDKLTTAVLNHGEEWHNTINNIVDKTIGEIMENKKQHKKILETHLDEIKQKQYFIEQTRLNLITIEKSNEVSMSIDYNTNNKELCKFPTKIQVSLSTFSPKSINTKQLYESFGSLTPLSKTMEENGYTLKKIREHLTEPKLITTINTAYERLSSVSCLSDEAIWTTARDSSKMKCFRIQGSLIKTIDTKSVLPLRDISMSSDGDLMYFDIDGTTRTINKINNGQAKEVIRLQGWVPLSLCVTYSDDLLITMHSENCKQSKVVCYSGSREKQSIQFDNECQPLYSENDKIKYITENRNLDICVADSGARAIIVVTEIGKFRFRYTGHLSTKDKPFKPYGIASDSQSQILTADSDNHCIHILDEDGQFLNFIENCNLKDPYGLCVDKNDDLFVAEFYSGLVKRIQYLT